jgi:hypothetical protein
LAVGFAASNLLKFKRIMGQPLFKGLWDKISGIFSLGLVPLGQDGFFLFGDVFPWSHDSLRVPSFLGRNTPEVLC